MARLFLYDMIGKIWLSIDDFRDIIRINHTRL